VRTWRVADGRESIGGGIESSRGAGRHILVVAPWTRGSPHLLQKLESSMYTLQQDGHDAGAGPGPTSLSSKTPEEKEGANIASPLLTAATPHGPSPFGFEG